MAKLMVHRNILKNFSRLPSKVQKRITGLIEEFQHDPESDSIGMHPLKGTMRDPKVRGVTKLPDGYRAIVIAPEKGDTYLLVHIDAHDKAYDWAKNKRFEVHEMTGTFQVFDAEEVEAVVQQAPPEEETVDYPLAKLSDEELFEAGVPKPLVPAVKSIRNDDGLLALSDYLPPDCRDVLYGLASGMTLEMAMQEMLGIASSDGTKPVVPSGSGDFSNLETTTNFDLVLVEDGEDLNGILDQMQQGTLSEWRVFLHPYQRKLVEWQTKGPMNITGSAGTGKTVALLHRAKHLAKNLEDPNAKILITTFTTNLSVTLKSMIEGLAPSLADRIEVTNLHSLARTICSRNGWRGKIAEDQHLHRIWADIWQTNDISLPFSKEEVQLEYDLIIDQNGIDTEDKYLSTVRSGRPRLKRTDRRALWPIFRDVRRALKQQDLLTFEGAVYEARLAIEQGKAKETSTTSPYAHVLVDEAQDFSLEALRLIRALSPIDQGTRDPLCMAGDGHQRIYRLKIPMSRAGINIVGRSRRLKINYRTSEQIRGFAQGILKGIEIDDLDGGISTTEGDHSIFKGPEPEIEPCQSDKKEAESVLAWIQILMEDHGFASHEICVTPRKPKIVTALVNADIPTFELKPNEEDPGPSESGVRMGTMQRIKGLEFRAIAMACADADDAMNDLTNASMRERCTRYVAATRARERLLVTLCHDSANAS